MTVTGMTVTRLLALAQSDDPGRRRTLGGDGDDPNQVTQAGMGNARRGRGRPQPGYSRLPRPIPDRRDFKRAAAPGSWGLGDDRGLGRT